MKQAKWIWHPGEFEIYHHMLLSFRRQEKGCDYPCVWHVCRPEANVRFRKTFTAEKDGAPLSLTRTEFHILALLISRPGRVYTRQQIIDATQSEEKAVTERTVDVQLVGLRRKLGDWATAHIETIRGVGYRVKP